MNSSGCAEQFYFKVIRMACSGVWYHVADRAGYSGGTGVCWGWRAGHYDWFGAQSLIKDLLAGLLIILENQYAKGDRITLGTILVVEDVSRLTVLR